MMGKAIDSGRNGRWLRHASLLAALLPCAALLWNPVAALNEPMVVEQQSATSAQSYDLLEIADPARWPQQAPLLAQQHGVRHCADRIAQLESWAGKGEGAAQGWMMLPVRDSDRNMFGMALVTGEADHPSYTVAALAPGQDNGCALGYQVVRYHPQSCSQLAHSELAGRPAHLFDGGRGYAIPTAANEVVALVPAGSGCVSVRGKLAY